MSEAQNLPLWTTDQILSWFKGLDDSLQQYARNIKASGISGAQLMALNYEDLNSLFILPIGHQELILDAAALLGKLHYELETENLQSHALEVNIRCKELRSVILSTEKIDELHDRGEFLKRGAPSQWLRLAADVLDATKTLVMWLDRIPFITRPNCKHTRNTIVKLSVELSVTVQQSVFLCVIQDAVTNICNEMEVAANQLVQSNDPMTLQPAALEQVTLVNSEAGLGLFIRATFDGHHVITGTREGSISSKIRRIVPGDEVVSVNGQTVIGWQLTKLVNRLKENVPEVVLVLKKRPSLVQTNSSILPLNKPNVKRFPKVPPSISPIQNSSLELLKDDSSSEKIKRRSYSDSFNERGICSNSPPLYKNSIKEREKYHKYNRSSTTSDLRSSPNGSLHSSYQGSINSNSSQDNSGARQSSSTKQKPRSREYLSLDGDETMPSRQHQTSQNKNEMSVTTINSQPAPRSFCTHSYMSLTHSGAVATPQQTARDNLVQDIKESLNSPKSPLDILTLPPPPEAPYTPREEHMLENQLEGNVAIPPPTGSESPNSMMDIEHRRRFTVIGGEKFDEKWYRDFLSKAPPKEKDQHKPLQPKKSEQILQEDDNVFSSEKSLTEKVSENIRQQVSHPHSASKIKSNFHAHRPVSMPPDYYSETQLQQIRKRAREGKRNSKRLASNRVLTTIPDEAPLTSEHNTKEILPDKKEALPFKSTKHTMSASPRSSSTTVLTDTDAASKRNSVRLSLAEYVHGRQNPQNPVSDQTIKDKTPTKLYHSQDHLFSNPGLLKVNNITRSSSPSKTGNELRNSGGRRKLDYVSDIPSPVKSLINDNSIKTTDHYKDVKLNSSPQTKKIVLIPPAVKPRTKSTSPKSQPVKTPLSSPIVKVSNSDEVKQPYDRTRCKSVENVDVKNDNSLIVSHDFKRSQSEVTIKIKKSPKKTAVQALQSSPNSARGSYVAAIEGGYSINEKNSAKQRQTKNRSKSSLTSSSNIPQNSSAYEVKLVSGVPVRLRKSTTGKQSNNQKHNKPPVKTKADKLRAEEMPSNRRISCRDLGDGECNGWLWKKKIAASSPLASKWSKRWVVLKKDGLYCYRTEDDVKAESYMQLLGYTITPANECKRKFAFRCCHPKRKTFYFASETQMDMSRWMNKMGLAAIGYKETSKDRTSSNSPEKYYSESDNDDTISNTSSSNRSSAVENKTGDKRSPNSSPEKTYTPHALSGLSFNMNAVNQHKKAAAARLKKEQEMNESNSKRPVPAKRLSLPPSTKQNLNVNDSINVNSESNSEYKAKNIDQSRVAKAQSAESLLKSGITATFMNNLESIEKLKLNSPKNKNESNEQINQGTPISKSKSNVGKTGMYIKNKDAKIIKRHQSQPGNNKDLKRPETLDMQPIGQEQKNKLIADSLSPTSQLARVLHPENNDIKENNPPKIISSGMEGSIHDLSKAIQCAEIDIHGKNRRVTLRRKMTVLHRDPKKNKLLLQHRTLKRQLKALEGDLEYYNDLLEKPKITSEILNDWLNRHQSLLADISSIRRLSKKKKKNVEHTGYVEEISTDKSTLSSQHSEDLDEINNTKKENKTTQEIIAEKAALIQLKPPPQETSFVGDSGDDSNQNVRPRSAAFSVKTVTTDTTTVSNINNNNTKLVVTNNNVMLTAKKPYLETDL